jgi:hypothetical protein
MSDDRVRTDSVKGIQSPHARERRPGRSPGPKSGSPNPVEMGRSTRLLMASHKATSRVLNYVMHELTNNN